MKLVMTVMVRDEADVIEAMIDYHLGQGVDKIIVTDNGSQDGTTEILESFAERGQIDLRHDPVHRKQQGSVVTQMARDAYTMYGADWVLNADADEFFVALDRSLSLHDVFDQIPKSIQSFLVPVVNMTGPPAAEGSGFQRLVYRDARPESELEAAGIRAHPTPNAIHVGDPEISVVQGNHLVSLASLGAPEDALGIEVLHLPWRSWRQYEHKVEVTGRAYDSNPELTPSPNHHGMRDYARLKLGGLLPYYFLRHPTEERLQAGQGDGQLVIDLFLSERIQSPVPDLPFDEETLTARDDFRRAWENERVQFAERVEAPLKEELEQVHSQMIVEQTQHERRAGELEERIRVSEERIRASEEMTDAYRGRLVIRVADKLGRLRHLARRH